MTQTQKPSIDFPVVTTTSKDMLPSTNAWSTRWRLKRLWYRSCYTFHWAHHPLCQTFRKDVLRIGRVHLCRSCCFVYLGIITTSIACAIFFPFFRENCLTILTAILAPTLLCSIPKLYKKISRPFRDLARFAMGTLLPITLGLLWTSLWPLAFVVFVLLYFFWRYYYKIRKNYRVNACVTCHEYGQQTHCSGAIHQATCLRNYEEAATALLYGTGCGSPLSGS